VSRFSSPLFPCRPIPLPTLLSALIVDDELYGAENLQIMLYKYCPEVDVKNIATTAVKAIEDIKQCKPDLVFLDIEMPYMNGFELLEEVKDIPFEIIFTTAYNTYAIEAIRHNAIDYLLKPIDSDELIEAVRRAGDRVKQKQPSLNNLGHLLTHMHGERKNQKLPIHNLDGIVFADIHKIVRLNADSNYTHIHMLDRKKYTVAKTLKEYEDLLQDMNFFRVHHAHLINLTHVERYIKGEGGYVEMADGNTIEVSRKKKNDLLRLLSL